MSQRHLWPHFAELSRYPEGTLPTIVRGDDCHVFDRHGRRYLDALASLYCVNVGYGRDQIVDAVAAQLRELPYFTNWSFATPPALELAERIAALAPDGFGRTFFTSGGSESVESAWKLARQYNRLLGRPEKIKIVAREGAYHGTTFGALSVTGVPKLREPFEPLVPGVVHAPRVDPYHAEADPARHSLDCADAVERLVLAEGPESVAAVIVEPVQNAGGCLTPEPVYFRRLREICDRHELLLISDDTICSWGRLGTWFGAEAFGYQPDIITTAKGMTSAYVPMGAVIASERVAEPFLRPGEMFTHGLTFGGHPGAAAAALANIRIIEEEALCERAGRMGERLQESLSSLRDIPIVGDIRGAGMFRAVELVADQRTKAAPTGQLHQAMVERIPRRLFEEGVICRAMHRGAPLLQFAPPLTFREEHLAELERALRVVLTEVAEAQD